MSFSVGIVGLPNAGKSTLFKALTRQKVDIKPYPFTTINPNIGVVHVPDERLTKVAEVVKPEKVTPTIIEFIDIAGLVKGAHKGEGLGNQFLSEIRNCDAILEIVRAFEDSNVEHVEGSINPERDIKTIETELLMKDFETTEKAIEKLEPKAKTEKQAVKRFDVLKKIKTFLSEGKLIADIILTEEEKLEIKEFNFLTEKPKIYLFNIGGKGEVAKEEDLKKIAPGRLSLLSDLKIEEEELELSPEETKELGLKSQLDQLIVACYNVLDLITFFTIAGGKETRAWTLKKGLKAPQAAGKVHSDFEQKFIRAEVILWESLIKAGSWAKARESGQMKTEGKGYIVQDGDVIEFKI
jgi:hypothetical protein